MQSVPVGPQEPPQASVPPSASNQFEHHDDLLNLPRIFARQWSLTKEIAPDNVISQRYMRSETPTARGLTLKEAIYIAMQEQPGAEGRRTRPGRLDGNRQGGQRNLRSEPYRAGRYREERRARHLLIADRWRRRVRAEILRLELRPQQSLLGHQRNLGRDLQQRSRAVEFALRRRQSFLHAQPRTLALTAIAAELRLEVRDHQRPDRRVGAEAGAMDLRPGAAGFRAENRRRLLERRARPRKISRSRAPR